MLVYALWLWAVLRGMQPDAIWVVHVVAWNSLPFELIFDTSYCNNLLQPQLEKGCQKLMAGVWFQVKPEKSPQTGVLLYLSLEAKLVTQKQSDRAHKLEY